MGQEELDRLLALVIERAAALGIPVSRRICPHVAVNRRARTRLGCCRSQSGRHTIELSAPLLEADEPAVCQVLAHEVLHTCPGCADHGPAWRHWAALMSARYGYRIRRTDSLEALGLPDCRPVRYLVVCRSCGRSIPRMKRSPLVEHPERYRCKCGGSLYVTTPAAPRDDQR